MVQLRNCFEKVETARLIQLKTKCVTKLQTTKLGTSGPGGYASTDPLIKIFHLADPQGNRDDGVRVFALIRPGDLGALVMLPIPGPASKTTAIGCME